MAAPMPAARPRVLIVGGSTEPSSAALVRSLARGCDAVVAVDRGLDVLLEAGCGCDLFCGDADSVSARGAALVCAAEQRNAGGGAADSAPLVAAVERYDPHKDFTDLALAQRAIRERWPHAALACTCLAGGRPDHALAVIGRLLAWDGPVALVEDAFDGRILHAGDAWDIRDRAGARFTFIPLSPEAVVSEAGMRWELNRQRVPLLSDLGISNVVEAAQATVAVHEGAVIAWCFR